MLPLFIQDGSSVPVAIKTCKVDNEDSMAEKFLEEACKCETIVLRSNYVLMRNMSCLYL